MPENQPAPTVDDLVPMLADSLRQGLNNILQGSVADVRDYALDLARMSAKISMEQDPNLRLQLLKSARSSTKILAEINKVRVANEAWDTLDRILLVATNVAAGLLLKAVVPPA